MIASIMTKKFMKLLCHTNDLIQRGFTSGLLQCYHTLILLWENVMMILTQRSYFNINEDIDGSLSTHLFYNIRLPI